MAFDRTVADVAAAAAAASMMIIVTLRCNVEYVNACCGRKKKF